MLHLVLAAVAALPCSDPTPRPERTRLYWGDLDADGLADVFVAHPAGANRLLRNRGDGGFDDVTLLAGLDELGPVREAHWEDSDRDGSLDLLVVAPGGSARLLRRGEGARFVDVTEPSGLDLAAGVRAVEWLDFDGDELPDLAVAGAERDRLWHNLGATFLEVPLGLPNQPLAPPATAGASELAPVAPAAAEEGGVGLGGGGIDQAFCPTGLYDFNLGGCVYASAVPTLGLLFPMSLDLNVTPAGRVGIGTTSPTSKLSVAGDIDATGLVAGGVFRSSVATGSAPVVVNSTTVCSNLNADRLDGLEASAFSQLGSSIEGIEITDLTITGADLAPNAVDSFKIADSTIVDADVRSTAAIQGGKIVPDFGTQDVRTLGDLGVGTNTPVVDLHVVGSSTLGAALVAPSEVVSGDDAELLLGEDDDGTYGMKLRYDGFFNRIDVLGRLGGVDSAPHLSVERDSGQVAIGSGGVFGGLLHVDGLTADESLALAVESNDSGIAGQFTSHSIWPAVYATNDSTGGAVGGLGHIYGVLGQAQAGGAGVRGVIDSQHPADHAVHGVTSISGTYAVRAQHTAASGSAWALYASSDSTSGRAMQGNASATSGTNYGVRGYSASSSGYGVYSSGDFGGSGAKYFVQPHPTDPSKEIRFVCLEGNESGTYFRGSADLVGGAATIEVPEEFRLVSEAEGLTVQVTPVGAPAALWIASQDLDRIEVRGNVDVSFHYFVNGVRRGWADHEPLRENAAFVPEWRGEPYGTQYPAAYRRLLVDNGILNPDFTPNETTAAALGWPLGDPAEREAREARHRAAPDLDAARERLGRNPRPAPPVDR